MTLIKPNRNRVPPCADEREINALVRAHYCQQFCACTSGPRDKWHLKGSKRCLFDGHRVFGCLDCAGEGKMVDVRGKISLTIKPRSRSLPYQTSSGRLLYSTCVERFKTNRQCGWCARPYSSWAWTIGYLMWWHNVLQFNLPRRER